MKRIAIVLALCLLVAACFKSERLLLDLRESAHPVAEGDWKTDGGDTFKLTIKGDHYLRVEGETRHDVVLVPLPGQANTYAAAESSENCTGNDANPECNWDYAIVVVVDGESWKQFAPSCKDDWQGKEQDVAKKADDGETCWFDDMVGLEHALVMAAKKGSTNVQEFHRPSAEPAAEAPPAEEPAEASAEPAN